MATRSALINVMHKAATAASRNMLRDFGEVENLQVSRKGPADFVSRVDTNAERIIKAELSKARPDWGLEMEESGITAGADPDAPCWIVDPLDGTKNFVKGKQAFCSMVALLWNGQPVQSWIWQPLTQTLFYAAEGQGAVRIDKNGAADLRLENQSDDVDLMFGSGNSLGLIEPQKSAFQARLRLLAGRRFTGSAGIQACLIASGDEDFLIHGNSTPWDHAPVDLLCREAGGYAAMLRDESRFHVAMKAPFMAVSSQAGWNCLRDAVWRD